jgi:hypothetical protein
MKFTALRLMFCAFLAMAFLANAEAQTKAGQIKAARVENEVFKQLPDGTKTLLKGGELLTENDKVVTGKGASVVLVFMNGSSVKLGSDTQLAIDEFKMDPLEEDLHTAGLKAEPTVSKTTLNLSYGEMVGDVKKLNTSSTYSIKTPVGAAGIRGTIFRVVYRPNGTGQAFFTLSTQEGRVVLQGVTTVEIPIVAGKEVAVTFELDKTGKLTGSPVIENHDISPEATAAINGAVLTIGRYFDQTFKVGSDSSLLGRPPGPQPVPPDPTPGAG